MDVYCNIQLVRISEFRQNDRYGEALKIIFRKKLRGDLIRVMLATIQSRTFWSSRLLSKHVKNRIYKIIILPVVLYGCETWSLRLKEKYRLRVFRTRC
jgi:hypothetical protein